MGTDAQVADKLRLLEEVLKIGKIYDPYFVRGVAATVEPDFIRHVHRESIAGASKKSRRSLTERIPQHDAQRLLIEMYWYGSKHWWQSRASQGLIQFEYDPKSRGYIFSGIHYVGHCPADRS